MNIKDIAKLAGVSPSTVSKVIHRKDKDISDKTRKTVLSVVQEYHYQPYMEALSRQEKHSHIIAVVMEQDSEEQHLLLGYLQSFLMRFGYTLMLLVWKEEQTEQLKCAELISRQYAEAVIVLTEKKSLFLEKALRFKEIPVINLVEEADKENEVSNEINTATDMAWGYLTRLGHHKIGMLGKAGINLQPALNKGKVAKKSIRFHEIVSIEKLRQDPEMKYFSECTAVLCRDSLSAAEFCRQAARAGLRVPLDMSVISLCDAPLAERFLPSITAVTRSWEKIAEALAKKAVAFIEKKKQPAEKQMDMCSLIVRDSTMPPAGKKGQKLLVVGSVHMDVNIRLPHIPATGEILTAASVAVMPGGKGTNQAVGAARLGADTYLIGCLGRDPYARTIYSCLQEEFVHCEGLRFDKVLDSGTAYINVPNKGESAIILYAGANRHLSSAWIRQKDELFTDSKVCLVSTEIPAETVEATLEICREHQIPVILKPSGITRFPKDLFKKVTIFVPSRRELKLLSGKRGGLEEQAKRIVELGVKYVIVTLGKQGCYYCSREEEQYFPAMKISAVDTTGGADAFISALAVYLSEGMGMRQAIGFATYSAGICVAQYGVQAVLPRRDELELFRDRIMTDFT